MNSNESACARALRQMDALMDRDIEPTAAQWMQHHLAACPECGREIELRRNLRNRLKSAVHGQSAPPFLGTRVRATLEEHATRPSRWMRRSTWAGASAVLAALAFVMAVSYQLGHLRLTVDSQDAYIAGLIQRVSSGFRPGLADHLHCSVYRKYPAQPPAGEVLRADLDAEYQPLLEIVQENVPPGATVHMAHQCSYRGRRFVHIGLKSGAGVTSLILARKQPGESFASSELRPAAAALGERIHGAAAQRFRIAGFASRDHFAYVVSEAGAPDAQTLLVAMTPRLRTFLARMEG